MAGHAGLELRNVDANYCFERSHRFAGIQPNSGFGDYSRLSCGVGDTLSARGPCDAHCRISEPSNRHGLQLYHEYNPKLVRCFMLVPAMGHFGLPMVKGLHASNTVT